MGFFKRFFSIGSRKNKSKKKQSRRAEQVDAEGRIVPVPEPWQDHDGDATRLLRSSSAHFAVVSEVDYSSLPPIPHPINNVAHTPATTPARSATSVKRSGTYIVKIHGRTTHSRTEFPNANPPLDDESPTRAPREDLPDFDDSPIRSHPNPRSVPLTPRDQSRIMRLGREPSVATLLNMYDDDGRIQSGAFDSSPSTPAPVHEQMEGREQRKRTGSTLRQLLGDPDEPLNVNGTMMEGDISWAERFLGEHADTSTVSLASTSSLVLETPRDQIFSNDPPTCHIVTNTTFATDHSHSHSQDVSANYPTFSSLEVEISETNDNDSRTVAFPDLHARAAAADPKTPQRASEVFGFLTERRKSLLERERTQKRLQGVLPALPTPDPTNSTDQTGTINMINNKSTTHYLTALPTPDTPTPNPMTTTTTTAMSASARSSPATTISTSTHCDTSSAQIHTATLTTLTPVTNPLSHPPRTNDMSHIPTPSSIPIKKPHAHAPRPNSRSSDTQPLPSHSAPASKIPKGPRPQPAPVSSNSTGASSSSSSSTALDTSYLYISSESAEPIPTCSLPQRQTQTRSQMQTHHSDRFVSTTTARPRHHQRPVSVAAATSDDDGAPPTSASPATTTSRLPRVRKTDKENSSPTAALAPSNVHASKPSHANSHPHFQSRSHPQSRSHSHSHSPEQAVGGPQQPPRSRTIFERRHPNLVLQAAIQMEPPSPVSSEDLSPVAKEMMAQVRKTRMRGGGVGAGAGVGVGGRTGVRV